MKDLQSNLDPFFDGIRTADETMNAISSLSSTYGGKERTALKRYVFDWLDGKITGDRAIAKIRHAYNL